MLSKEDHMDIKGKYQIVYKKIRALQIRNTYYNSQTKLLLVTYALNVLYWKEGGGIKTSIQKETIIFLDWLQ